MQNAMNACQRRAHRLREIAEKPDSEVKDPDRAIRPVERFVKEPTGGASHHRRRGRLHLQIQAEFQLL